MHLFISVVFLSSASFVQGALEDKFHNFDLIHNVDFHTVSKRSTGISHTKEMKVSIFGKNFTLELKQSHHLFSQKFQITVIDSDNVRTIVDDFNKENFLSGSVVGETNSRASLHVNENNQVTGVFTAGDEEYIMEPASKHLDGDALFMQQSPMVAYRRSDIKTDPDNPGLCGSVHAEGNSEKFDDLTFKVFNQSEPHVRQKRATNSANTCMLTAVVDYKFYQHIGESNIYTAANYVANIINRVNQIYRSTDFSSGSGYGFELDRMTVHKGPTSAASGQYLYNIAKNWGTVELLEALGKTTEYSETCLTHLFTSQAMSDSVLGLGYIASANSGTLGGLCSPSSSNAAFNTGWSTSKNGAGNSVTFTQHALVTAHEFGHNWGSEHDPDTSECAPGTILSDGKYLMYAYSVTGEDPNNDLFSTCSRGTMSGVINNKGGSCFQVASVESLCGNGRLDSGEQCDGGFLGRVGLDVCCNSECILTSGATCSPNNYACCSNECLLSASGIQCQSDIDGGCQLSSTCDGINLQCPAASNKPDGTDCLDGGSCLSGQCKSYCEYRNLVSCLCFDVGSSCKKCCRDPITNECGVIDDSVLLADGRSCVQGYCDNGQCIKVAADLVERAWEFIDKISINFLVESFKTNVIACVTGFSLILYIPICIVIWCIDRRRKKAWERENSVHIRTDRGLARDEDKRPVATTNKPRSHPATLDPSEYLETHSRRNNRSSSSRNTIQPLDFKPNSSHA